LLGEFGHSVASCKTLDGVRETFRKEIARHGYVSSACRAFVPAKDGTKIDTLLFRNSTKDWAAISDGKRLQHKSFSIVEARRRMTPFTWRDITEARMLSTGEQETWDAMLDSGWENGFVLPVHGPGGYFAAVSMGSPERDLDLGHDNRLRLQLIATLAHERSRALARLGSSEGPLATMSARELECLRWVADGKTDGDIANILSISATTVKFHVDRARAKLGARTRAQAVARLVLYGLY
jgi:DNA-binding CsgD family transcriptional regulator